MISNKNNIFHILSLMGSRQQQFDFISLFYTVACAYICNQSLNVARHIINIKENGEKLIRFAL